WVGNDAGFILDNVLPHLRLKQEQAKIAMECRELK
ncbi:unnamed protein product, partial [marine sediment metagenome]